MPAGDRSETAVQTTQFDRADRPERWETFSVADIPVVSADEADALRLVRGLAKRSGGADVHLCNAYSIACAKDPAIKTALASATANLVDGVPLLWSAKVQGLEVPSRPVRGPDFMIEVLRDGVADGARHVVYGSSPATVEALRVRLAQLAPGADILEFESPPFRALTQPERASLIDRWRSLAPDCVWVGLGTPKQDLFCADMKDEVPAVFIAVGAALDYAAGTLPQAPAWLQGRGFEWTYRLAVEPRRLFGRYARTAVAMLAELGRNVLGRVLRSGHRSKN